MAEGEVQGPIQPGTDAKLFRRTGRTRRLRRGPVRPNIDEEYFRRTGKTRTIAQRDAQQKADREAKALEKKLKQEEQRKEEQRKKEVQKGIVLGQQQRAEKERQRIARFRQKIISKGARKEIKNLRNKEGDRIRTVTTFTRGRKERIFEVFNLDKGTVNTKTFDKGKQTGGLKIQKQKQGPENVEFETKIIGEVQKFKEAKSPFVSRVTRLSKVNKFLENKLRPLRTANLRRKLTNTEGLQVIGYSILSTIGSFTSGLVDTPEFLFKIAKNPSVIKKLPSFIDSSGKQFGQSLRVSPTETITKIGTNILLLRGSGIAIDKLIKTSKTGLVTATGKSLGKAETGTVIKIPKKGGGFAQLEVVAKIPKQTIQKQIGLSGKKVNAISSQADALLGIIKRSKGVKKPLGSTKELSKKATQLLNKFDKGTITKKELQVLDSLIKKSGSKGLLERSFFADPTGKIRPSRLGLTSNEKVKLLDYLTGDISFRSQKPQILFFDSVRVQKFPTSLKKIIKKLESGKPLTNAEELQLLQFQLKKSGKFKPLGFVTKEAELTLSPGEILKRNKLLGFIKIKGQSIPVISVKVFKPSKKIQQAIKLYENGKLTSTQARNLDKILRKQTGINYKLSSSYNQGRININLKSLAYRVLSGKKTLSKKLSKKTLRRKVSTSTTSKTSKKKKLSKLSKKKTSKTSKGKTSKKGTSKTSKAKTSKPKTSLSRTKGGSSKAKGGSSKTKPVTKKKPIILGKKVKRKQKVKIVKSSKGYNVFARPLKKNKKSKIPKLVKANDRPLTLQRARDLRNYILDTSLSRTGTIKPTKGKPRKTKLRVPVGYAKRTIKKFRRVKIKRGKKIRLSKNKVIEKRKNLLDTKQEKKKISLRRRIKQITPKKKFTKKRTVKKKSMSKTAMAKKMAKLRAMKKKR